MKNEQDEVPNVTDKRVVPPGILPPNIQRLVLGGLAAVMVVVIFFSGRSTPKPPHSPTPPGAETTIFPPSDEKLKDYQQRLEDASQKLTKEQEELARNKKALAGATNQQILLSGPGGGAMNSDSTPSAHAQTAQEQKSWAQQEEEKREYLSRFASNIAQSYRKDLTPASGDVPAQPAQSLPPIDPRLYPWALPLLQGAPVPQPTNESAKATKGSEENSKPAERAEETTKKAQPDLNRSAGKDYRLFEGTFIETVLTNRLDGTFSGPVNCMVSYDVYSHDHSHILIPSGSRALGNVHPVDNAGQQRLAVSFHRLIMPDGFVVDLDQFHGLDQVGETGLRDQVNHHYVQIFGAAIAVGMIAGLAQSNTQYGTSESATDAYRQGVANSLSQSSTHILDRFLNILPTITIREGQRIKIYLSEDLALPAYDNHEMSGDI